MPPPSTMLATGVNDVLSGSAVPSNVAIARKELEEELEEHLKAIVMIKRRLNTLTTISRLPGEVLSEIFLCIAQDYFRSYVDNMERSSCDNHPCGDPGWIRVAHVCHAWSKIALTTPRLWGAIPVIRRSMADQLLARSKQAPLSVAIDNFKYDDEWMAFLDTIFCGQTSRLTELFINSRYWIVYELCDKITEPANLLHTLALSDSSSNHRANHREHIPHDLFDGHTPRLRNLDIRGLVIRWDNPLLCPTLTSLIITACCDPKVMGTFEHLLSALESMSCLRTLELTNAIPQARKALDSSSPRVITFPNLSNLRLNGDAHLSAHFLDHISLATNVLPQLACEDWQPCILDLILAVKAHFARSDPLRILQLRQEYFWLGQQLCLCAWNTNVTFADTFAITEPAPFVFEITDSDDLSTSIYQDIFQFSAAFASIQTLVIMGRLEDRESAWTAIFAGTPNLCELVVQHAGTKSMPVVLSSTSTLRVPGDLEENYTSSPLLPLLEVVRFNDVRLDGPIFGMKEECFHQLVECTTFRRNSNCPIQEIYIMRCRNVVEEDVECLRKIVPVVMWDEVVDVEDVPDVRDEEDGEEDEEDEDEDNEDEDEDEDEDNEDEDEDSEEDEGDNESDEDEDEEDRQDGDDSTDSNDELGDDHPFGGNMNPDPDDSDHDGA